MTKGKTDLANQLLEQHVKHELASLKGAKLRKFLEQELDELWHYAGEITLGRITSEEQVMGVIQRIVMGMELDAGIPELAAELGLPIREGVGIQDVLPGGPSDQSGIRQGDIILSMGGSKVATITDLTRLLRKEFAAGQVIEVELFREGSTQTLTLTLGERPSR